jgi:hypothetical protein
MAAVEWLVFGRLWTTQTPIIDGVSRDVTASLGGLYLVHPTTAALDMLARLVAAMTTGGVASPAAFVTEAGYVRLTSSGVFTIDWTTGATTLRDLLGFTGNLAAASAYTAANRSPLLWRPGKVLTPELAQLGVQGQRVLDISATIGQGGNLTVRQEGTPTTVNRFSGRYIPKARYQNSTTPSAGDYTYAWEYELCTGKKFHILRGVTEGSSTTASASYGSATMLGPYVADLSDGGFRRTPMVRSAGFGLVEAYYDITVPAVLTSQFA